MDFILASIAHACATGASFPALVTALTVPDIAGAVDQPAAGSQHRYAAWMDTFFCVAHPSYVEHGLDGFAFYALRCKLLHEGLTNPSEAPAAQKSAVGSKKRLVAFNVGDGVRMHLCTSRDASGESITVLRTEQFCEDLTAVARTWLEARRADPAASALLDRLVTVRTEVGALSHGVPHICAAL